jgi:hypothetical protein
MIYYKLEFNDSQQLFHFADLDEETPKEWEVISPHILDKEAEMFCNYYDLYKGLNNSKTSSSFVKCLYSFWIFKHRM